MSRLPRTCMHGHAWGAAIGMNMLYIINICTHTQTHTCTCSRMHACSCAKAPKAGPTKGSKKRKPETALQNAEGKDIEKTNVTMDPVLDFNFGLAYVAQFHAWWGMYGCANSLRYRFGDSAWQTGDDAWLGPHYVGCHVRRLWHRGFLLKDNRFLVCFVHWAYQHAWRDIWGWFCQTCGINGAIVFSFADTLRWPLVYMF